jgi:hypothetical protein
VASAPCVILRSVAVAPEPPPALAVAVQAVALVHFTVIPPVAVGAVALITLTLPKATFDAETVQLLLTVALTPIELVAVAAEAACETASAMNPQESARIERIPNLLVSCMTTISSFNLPRIVRDALRPDSRG